MNKTHYLLKTNSKISIKQQVVSIIIKPKTIMP